jgi:hypothetical protein
MLADYIHEHVIPAIEAWAANFDSWWADHGQPFIDDVTQAWTDIKAEAAAAMGVTEEDFTFSLESMETVAGIMGTKIGTKIGESLGAAFEAWWERWKSEFWPRMQQWFIDNSAIFGAIDQLLGGNQHLPTAPVPPTGPNMGPSMGGFGMAPAVTINNYVDAQSRSVGEAARDGTLDGLRQAGMR